jgi:hypothetical protein
MRQRLDFSEFDDSLFRSRFRMLPAVFTLQADNEVLGADLPPYLVIDPDGAKDVLLPVEDETTKGLTFIIFNAASGAETITVKDDSDTDTIATITQGQFAIVICDGDAWRGFVFDQTVAASLTTLTTTGDATIGGDAQIDGAAQIDGLAKSDVGFQTNDTAVIATSDGLTTGLIAAGTGFVSVTNATNGDDIATLPAGTAANVGMSIWGWSVEAHELRTPASSGATINGVDSDGTQEAAIPATTLWEARLVAVDTWILRAWDELAAAISEIVPD